MRYRICAVLLSGGSVAYRAWLGGVRAGSGAPRPWRRRWRPLKTAQPMPRCSEPRQQRRGASYLSTGGGFLATALRLRANQSPGGPAPRRDMDERGGEAVEADAKEVHADGNTWGPLEDKPQVLHRACAAIRGLGFRVCSRRE